jgi:hypothetical protein
VVRSDGTISTLTGTTGGVLSDPWGIWGDSIGNLFIADTNYRKVMMLSLSNQTLSTIAGTGAKTDTGDGGSPISAAFLFPTSIWGDSEGLFLLIADYLANRIRIIDKSLDNIVIYTAAGTGTGSPSGSTDGIRAISTNILKPYGVWGNTAGNIFLTEYGGKKARKLYLPSPSTVPSIIPSVVPSAAPSTIRSAVPSIIPSEVPTAVPSAVPSEVPSAIPSTFPSADPSTIPSAVPSAVPSQFPSADPSIIPSADPSKFHPKFHQLTHLKFHLKFHQLFRLQFHL